MNAQWVQLIAELVGTSSVEVERNGDALSFVRLGGTSLAAMRLTALAEERLGRAVDVAALLGPRPVAAVVAEAPPAETRAQPRAAGGELRPVSAMQAAMLLGDELRAGTTFHLLFSARLRGPLDARRLVRALTRLTQRHEALRTVFVRRDGGFRRRVLTAYVPELVEQVLPGVPAGADPVAAVHTLLAPASSGLLRACERPPLAFVLTRVGDDHVLSLLIHHAIVDGWSIGLLWRELAAFYAADDDAAVATAPTVDRLIDDEGRASLGALLATRLGQLAGAATTVELPSDLARPPVATQRATRLHFELGNEARRGCEEVAAALGVTRNAVLLAAWALVIARRTAALDFVMGMSVAGRTDADAMTIVGPCIKLLPVRCTVASGDSARQYIERVAGSMQQALEAAALPFEHVVAALNAGGDRARNPVAQVAFSAHDALVPTELHAGDVTLELHEGHCGGSVFDAVLFVQRWDERARLALEYATDVLRPNEAAELAGAIEQTLAELAAGLDGPLAQVRSMTAAQRQQLATLAEELPVEAEHGLWQLITDRAALAPDAPAVRDGDATAVLSYRQLIAAVERQSAALAAAGVGDGDCVGLATPRSAREIVGVLAILRLGAAYTGFEAGMPAAVVQRALESAGAHVVLGDPARLQPIESALVGRTALHLLDPWRADDAALPIPPAPAADPSRAAYLGFTSGSTGIPKGTRISHRGVVRLARHPAYLRRGACDRFMRIAPLAFDASTLEIFVPLLSGGCIEIYPDLHVAPTALADFLKSRAITGVWLTAGLFRLVADYRADAFAQVLQVFTGGDVVPPQQVKRVLETCPGLRVTNGYGPTECTTFTSVHHIEDTAEIDEPLPIGRPIQGTGVYVLDGDARLVPPGGIGELYVSGEGLALDYAGRPAETAAAFGQFCPDLPHRLYRTGDLVRWDARGRLRFLGRRDHQVKIRGFRIELDSITRTLREFPGVRDAVVVPTGLRSGDRRLIAGIVAPDEPGLIASLREFAAQRLPEFAMPSLWALVADLPTTPNGKVDAARLEQLATAAPSGSEDASAGPAPAPVLAVAPPSAAPSRTVIEEAIAVTWKEVLGDRRFGDEDRFFDVGGDSLQLLRVAASLQRSLPAYEVSVQALHAHPTIRGLARHLETMGAVRGGGAS